LWLAADGMDELGEESGFEFSKKDGGERRGIRIIWGDRVRHRNAACSR
jgi:hypothetical protein